MKRIKQILLFLLIFVGLPFGGLALLWKDRCKEAVIKEVPLLQAGFKALQVTTDCGPSMKVATEVRLTKPKESGSGDESATVLLLAGKVDIPFYWGDGPTLHIDIPKDHDVVSHKMSWAGVQMVFTNIPEPKTNL